MNLSEAYKILNIEESASIDEVKKQFKKLAAKKHPDVNKEPNAESEFKKINEAYQIILNPPQEQQSRFNPFADFGEFGFPFQQSQQQRYVNNINLSTNISFKDSVLGTKVELKYSRDSKCPKCNGSYHIRLDNGCKKCHGAGSITTRSGNSIFTTTCNECHGQIKTKQCDCNHGTVLADVTVNVTIPGGVTNNNILRLGGMGNFVVETAFGTKYTDVLLKIIVEQSELYIENNDVISTTSISLLDAIQGCTKSIQTIDGNKDIEIKKLTRNKDEVIIPNLGVNRVGNQKVIIDVTYPETIEKLISTLKE